MLFAFLGGIMLMLHHWRPRIAALLCTAALLTLTACATNVQGGSSNPTATSGPKATATAKPAGCAALLPGATAAKPMAGFTTYTLFPSGSVMAPLHVAYGGTGQFTIRETDICYPGTVSQVNGPYHDHTSIYAHLLGAGLDFNSGFPYDGVTAADACASGASCFNTNGLSSFEHYISFEKLVSPQSGFVTYRLRVATPPANPACSPPGDYSGQSIIHTWKITNTLIYAVPPLTKGSTTNMGSGYAGGNLYWLCSAGSGATILQFMKGVAQSHGETLLNSTSTGFKVCIKQAAGQYFSVTITTSSGPVWQLNQTIPVYGDPTC
jgi:hypothetical protein